MLQEIKEFGKLLITMAVIVGFMFGTAYAVERIPFFEKALAYDYNPYPQEPLVYLSHHNHGIFVIDRVSALYNPDNRNYEPLERIATFDLNSGRIDTVRIAKDGKYVLSWLMPEFNNHPCPHEWFEVKDGKIVIHEGWLGSCG